MKLDVASARVLGALMEKEMTTPDLYPLSVNALIAAANQRSSRDPVMDLSEDEVRGALDVLEANGLVAQAREGGRVTRFEHRIRTVLNLRRDETAIVCLLLLRGAQTPGELRSRAERMFAFDDLQAVQAALDRLAGAGGTREEPVTTALPRAPGSREIRYMHLLGDAEAGGSPVARAAGGHDEDQQPGQQASVEVIDELRGMVAALELRVRALEER